MVTKVVKFIANDGEEFDTEELALQHEKNEGEKTEIHVQQFLKSYYGEKLQKKYTMNTIGIWQVYGEDPNCDLGGHHHMPYIGTIEGPLGDVIRWAVQQDGWFAWGGGGEIRKIDIKKIDTRWTVNKKL